jgi:hypothetical protein
LDRVRWNLRLQWVWIIGIITQPMLFSRTCGSGNTYFTPAVFGCTAHIPRDASRQFQRARRRWVSSHPLMWQRAASFFILNIRVFLWSKMSGIFFKFLGHSIWADLRRCRFLLFRNNAVSF